MTLHRRLHQAVDKHINLTSYYKKRNKILALKSELRNYSQSLRRYMHEQMDWALQFGKKYDIMLIHKNAEPLTAIYMP